MTTDEMKSYSRPKLGVCLFCGLWKLVTGQDEGLLCIPCFNALAVEKQITIWFNGAEGGYPVALAELEE